MGLGPLLLLPSWFCVLLRLPWPDILFSPAMDWYDAAMSRHEEDDDDESGDEEVDDVGHVVVVEEEMLVRGVTTEGVGDVKQVPLLVDSGPSTKGEYGFGPNMPQHDQRQVTAGSPVPNEAMAWFVGQGPAHCMAPDVACRAIMAPLDEVPEGSRC